MKKESILNFLKITVCVFLSIVFVLGVVTVPFYYSIVALTEPETVSVVIQEVDYNRVIQENPTLKETLARYNITPSKADSIMKSEKAGKLVEIYTDEVTELFLNIPDEQRLDVPYLKRLVEENTDKFLDIAEDNADIKLNREKTKQSVTSFIEKNGAVIEESAAVIEDVRDVVKTVYTSRVLEKKLSLWIGIELAVAALILIAVIVVLMRSGGFLWVGIDFAIASVLLGLIVAFCGSSFVSKLALKMSDFGTHIVESAITVSTPKIITALFITVVMTVLFTGFFAAIKLMERKYKRRIPEQEEGN